MIAKTIATAPIIVATGATASGAAGRSDFSPAWDEAPLEACLEVSGSCGKPAADAFCRANGYAESILFQRLPLQATRRLDSGQTCNLGACMGFRQIKCYSPSGELAGAQPG